MKIFYLLSLILFPSVVVSQNYDSDRKISPEITKGVLHIKSFTKNSPESKKSILIRNSDGQIIDSLYCPDNGDNCRFTSKISARVYYYNLDTSYIFFDSYPQKNGQYKVFFNDSWYYINHVEGITEYIPWEKFILQILFFDTSLDNPLHEDASKKSNALDFDYDAVFFSPKKVKGDWVYVDVFQGEEIFDPIGHGWLRWRDGNKLLLKTFYFSI